MTEFTGLYTERNKPVVITSNHRQSGKTTALLTLLTDLFKHNSILEDGVQEKIHLISTEETSYSIRNKLLAISGYDDPELLSKASAELGFSISFVRAIHDPLDYVNEVMAKKEPKSFNHFFIDGAQKIAMDRLDEVASNCNGLVFVTMKSVDEAPNRHILTSIEDGKLICERIYSKPLGACTGLITSLQFKEPVPPSV